MELSEYQQMAATTAVYDQAGLGTWQGLAYIGLGAAGEAGEIANKVKKINRDNGMVVSLERREAILHEVGDCLWYLAMMCTELGASLNEVAIANVSLLERRTKSGTIWGDGDTR